LSELVGYLTPIENLEGTMSNTKNPLEGNLFYGVYVDPYTHPETHPASMITESEDRVFLSSEEKTQVLNYQSGYVHDQIASSALWTITHTLGKNPSVSVVDSSGNLVMGEVCYISLTQITISFTAAFSGKAYLN